MLPRTTNLVNFFFMLEVLDLHFDYQEQPLLQGVNIHLPAGKLVHLKGANGAGKTTLMKLIAGLFYPIAGQIQFLGQDIYSDLAAYQRQLCFIGHKAGINPGLTLRENCFYDVHYHNNDIDALASLFQLQHHLDFPCGLLSSGQRRQVGLMRLWMSTAKLWLLDEPFVALDDRAQVLVMQQIDAHCEQGGSVLLTSHQQLPATSMQHMEYCL